MMSEAPNSLELDIQRNKAIVEESISIITPPKSIGNKMRSRESSIEVQDMNSMSDDADRDWTFVDQKRRADKSSGAIPKGVTIVDSSSDEEDDVNVRSPVAPAPAPRAEKSQENVVVASVAPVPQVDG